MAVTSSTSAVVYTGNGSNTVFYAVPFPFLLASDIYVAVQHLEEPEILLQAGVGYVLTVLKDAGGNITGGNVKTTVAYDGTWKVTIFRQVPLTQLTELPEAGPISSRAIEKGYDKLVMAVQQLHRRILELEGNGDDGSVIVVPEGSTGLDALQDVQAFADAAARGNAVPRRVGQLGVQIDQGSLWRSYGGSAGAWVRHNTEAVEEASAASNAAVVERLPAGCMTAYGGSVAPAGWLFCYGQVVSRVTYAMLFAAIGTNFGAGDGSTTFALPDLRGRVAAGRDDMGGSAASRLTNSGTGNPGIDGAALGAAGGTDRHTLTTAQMPAHTHNLPISEQIGGFGSGAYSGASIYDTSSGSAGSSEAHSNVQPSLVVNYIIRA